MIDTKEKCSILQRYDTSHISFDLQAGLDLRYIPKITITITFEQNTIIGIRLTEPDLHLTVIAAEQYIIGTILIDIINRDRVYRSKLGLHRKLPKFVFAIGLTQKQEVSR